MRRTHEETHQHDIHKSIVLALLLLSLVWAMLGAKNATPMAPVLALDPALKMPTDKGLTKFSGIATPGNKIQLLGDGVVLANGTAGKDGKWTLEPKLDKLPKQFIFQEIGPIGTAVATIKQDVKATAPAVAEPVAPQPAPIAPTFAIASPLDKSSAPKGDWTISGTGNPGDGIVVYMDKWKIGTTKVDKDGKWEIKQVIHVPKENRLVKALDTTKNVFDKKTFTVTK